MVAGPAFGQAALQKKLCAEPSPEAPPLAWLLFSTPPATWHRWPEGLWGVGHGAPCAPGRPLARTHPCSDQVTETQKDRAQTLPRPGPLPAVSLRNRGDLWFVSCQWQGENDLCHERSARRVRGA